MVAQHSKLEDSRPFVDVIRTSDGWYVREQKGETVIRLRRFSDWHRVERAVAAAERSQSSCTERED